MSCWFQSFALRRLNLFSTSQSGTSSSGVVYSLTFRIAIHWRCIRSIWWFWNWLTASQVAGTSKPIIIINARSNKKCCSFLEMKRKSKNNWYNVYNCFEMSDNKFTVFYDKWRASLCKMILSVYNEYMCFWRMQMLLLLLLLELSTQK